MHRVVIEKERRGSSNPNRNSKLKISPKQLDEDQDFYGPSRLKMSMNVPKENSNYSKEFTDVLAPIMGWLHKQAKLRRPWAKVYSEIRKAFPNRSSQPIRHIWEAHLNYEIEQHCRLGEDGKIYKLQHNYFRGGGGWVEIEDKFYVHPVNGLFLYAPKKKKVTHKIPEYMKKYKGKIHRDTGNITLTVSDSLYIVRLKGIWYFQWYDKVTVRDIVTKKFREETIITKTKQLSKKELKAYKLVNNEEIGIKDWRYISY